ncbi:MAG: DUF3574 domain-containing protein [Rudaea sp.]
MRFLTLLLGSCLLLCACAAPGLRAPAAVLVGDAAHPAAEHWLRTELYFGLGPADDATAGANEKRWRDFLDREITPRFPDGLSVYDVYGQWLGKGESSIERLHSKEVMLLHADTAQHRADIDAIRAAWKRATGDKSVLRVSQPAEVSF